MVEPKTQKHVQPLIVTDVAALRAQMDAGLLPRPYPTIGCVTGTDRGLIYPGKTNVIAGESTTGKTWAALSLARCEAVNRERATLWLDFEDSDRTMVGRMREVGWPSRLDGHMIHLPVRGPLGDHLAQIHYLIREHDPRLIVIDSVEAALGMGALESVNSGDVVRWLQGEVEPMALLGAGVLLIDHMTKSGGGGRYAFGSVRKLNSITGVQYVTQKITPFSRERGGSTRLICAKDRSGEIPEGPFAEVTFTPGSTLDVSIAPIRHGIDDRIARIVAAVIENPGCVQDAARKAGRISNTVMRSLVDQAVADGLIRVEVSRGSRRLFPVGTRD